MKTNVTFGIRRRREENGQNPVRILLRERKKILTLYGFIFLKKGQHDILFREEQILAAVYTCSICLSLLCGFESSTFEQALHQVMHLEWTVLKTLLLSRLKKTSWVHAITQSMYQHISPCPAIQIWRHQLNLKAKSIHVFIFLAFETIKMSNKLIQLLFAVETKLRSEHSSPATKKPDLAWSRGNVRFGAWAAIQLIHSYLKSRLFHTPLENKRQREHNGSVKGNGRNTVL